MKPSKQFSLRIVIALVGIGPICAKSAPPQIIEVHKDLSVSDEDRLDDFKTRGMSRINSHYHNSCFVDTTYWVISAQIFPNKKKSLEAGGRILKLSNTNDRAFSSAGAGSYLRSFLPPEIQGIFSNHYILTSNWIENCTSSDSTALAKKFGRDNVHTGDDNLCAVDDTIETIDSSLVESKKRAQALGEETRKTLPKLFKKASLDFYNGGGEVFVVGACLGKTRTDSLLQTLGANVLGVRILAK